MSITETSNSSNGDTNFQLLQLLTQKDEEINNLKETNKTLETNLENLSKKLNEENISKYKDLDNKYNSILIENEKLNDKINSQTNTIQYLNKINDTLQFEIDEINKSLQNYEEKVAELNDKYKLCKNQLNDKLLEIEKLNKSLKGLNRENVKLKDENNEYFIKTNDLSENLNYNKKYYESIIDKLQEDIKILNEKNNKSYLDLNSKVDYISKLNDKMSSLYNENHDLNIKLTEIQRFKNEQEIKLEKLNFEFNKINNKYNDFKSKISSYLLREYRRLYSSDLKLEDLEKLIN